MRKPIYVDMGSQDEDARIAVIVKAVMAGNRCAVITDDDPPEKLERYLAKIKAKCPLLKVIDTFKGPTPGAVTARVEIQHANN